MTSQRRSTAVTGAAVALALLIAVLRAPAADAASSNASPSDSRARFEGGNATKCADVGHGGDVQLGSRGTQSDPYVAGTVTGRKMLEVRITDAGENAGVTIHAVVVKGSDGHNIYEDPDVLPPNLGAPQNYISPLNGGGHVADISHWFVCYTLAPPARGRLRVVKRVQNPVGDPVRPLPGKYTVDVECEADGEVIRGRFTFGAGGGVGRTEDGATSMTDIPAEAVCRVREVNADELPEGCVLDYDPLAAESPGVRMRRDAGLVIQVFNDCRDVEVRRGDVEIVKRVVPPPPGVVLPDFVINVECAYHAPVRITIPGSGGPPERVNGVIAGKDCLVSEQTGSLPPGVQVSYSIDGAPSPVAGAALFNVVADRTVTVTITNDASGPGPVPPPAPPPPDLSVASTPTLDLDKTARRARVSAGGRMQYTIRVHNRGRGDARRVVVCDRLPRAMTVVSAPGARARNRQVCWRIAHLRPLDHRRFTLTVRANRRASGGATNVATAAAPGTSARAQVRVRILRRRPLAPPPVTG